MRKQNYSKLTQSTVCLLGNFACPFVVCRFFFKFNFFKKFFQEYHPSVEQFGSRSGPTICRAWSGSKLFAKVFCRRQLILQHEQEDAQRESNARWLIGDVLIRWLCGVSMENRSVWAFGGISGSFKDEFAAKYTFCRFGSLLSCQLFVPVRSVAYILTFRSIMNKGALTWVNEPFRSPGDYMLCKMYSKWHFEISPKLEKNKINDLNDAKI